MKKTDKKDVIEVGECDEEEEDMASPLSCFPSLPIQIALIYSIIYFLC